MPQKIPGTKALAGHARKIMSLHGIPIGQNKGKDFSVAIDVLTDEIQRDPETIKKMSQQKLSDHLKPLILAIDPRASCPSGKTAARLREKHQESG